MKGYSIRVYGKVQGVFYRDSTRRKAGELALKGFVRNEPDGSVYIEAEGEERLLEALVSWCKEGPPHAFVERVELKEREVTGFTEFIISR